MSYLYKYKVFFKVILWVFYLEKEKILRQAVCVMKRKIYIMFIVAFLFGGAVFAKIVCAAEKVKVVDGDSLVINREEIRLQGIDAPELSQNCSDENGEEYECGKEAMNFLRKIILKTIKCRANGKDVYERTLAECFDDEGQSINRLMVVNGWAIAYGEKYEDEEKIAKAAKKGVWKGKFMRPELYRAVSKSKKTRKKFKKR